MEKEEEVTEEEKGKEPDERGSKPTLKPKSKNGENSEYKDDKNIDTIGSEDVWTFDGKKGYEKPSGTDMGVKDERQKEKVEEITADRKEELANKIAGEREDETPKKESRSSGIKSERETPPSESESEPELEPEPEEMEEVFSEDVERYEIRQEMPSVSGETAKDLGQDSEEEEEESNDAPSESAVDQEEVEELKNQMEDLSQKVDNFSEEINELSQELTDIDEEISLLVSRMDKLEKRELNYSKVEEKLKELSALYDLLSSDVSPFMELDGSGQERRTGKVNRGLGNPEANPLDNPNQVRTSEKNKGNDSRKGDKPSNGGQKYDMKAVIDWVDFLYSKTGGNLEKALEYYEDQDWIGEDLKESILSSVEGMKFAEKRDDDGDKIIDSDGQVKETDGDWRLSPQDHKESLQYIEAIKKSSETNSEEKKVRSKFQAFDRGEN